MKITKTQLKRIIREEYNTIQRKQRIHRIIQEYGHQDTYGSLSPEEKLEFDAEVEDLIAQGIDGQQAYGDVEQRWRR